MVNKSRTFVNKRGLIPEITVSPWKGDLQILISARIYVARHARDGTDLHSLLEILGIYIGAENEIEMPESSEASNHYTVA